MIVLLSPAKKLDENSDYLSIPTSEPVFQKEASQIMGKLSKLSRKKVGSLMNISANLAELNYNRYRQWGFPFTEENAQPSIFAFRGDVYRGIDADTMDKGDLKFAQQHVRILSGLHGILRPFDLIQPYRLEMGTSINIGRRKNLVAFWKDKVTPFINEELAEEKEPVVVNLASKEYFNAVDTKKLKARVVTCQFKEYRDGKPKPIFLFIKVARGLMTRYIINNRITDPELLKGFDLEGYGFDANLSSEDEWVFTR